jgi:hypothetical protein
VQLEREEKKVVCKVVDIEKEVKRKEWSMSEQLVDCIFIIATRPRMLSNGTCFAEATVDHQKKERFCLKTHNSIPQGN